MCILNHSIYSQNLILYIYCTAVVIIISTFICIAIAGNFIGFALYGIDSIINSVALMLSFNVLDTQYNILCKCCINWSNRCLKRNKHTKTRIDIKPKKNKITLNDDSKGEITATTIYGIQTINITQTQNEGRQIIHLKSLSSMDVDNELKTKGEYEMNAIKHVSYYIDNPKTHKPATTHSDNIPNIFITPQ